MDPIELGISYALAAVLITAAVGKLVDITGFATAVGLALPRGWSAAGPAVARAVVAFELIAGVAALVPVLRTAGLLIATLLFAAFTVVAVRSARSPVGRLRCSCFGPGGETLGWPHVVRNAGLTLAAAAGAFLATSAPPAPAFPAGIVQGVLIVLIAFAVAAASIFLDDLVSLAR